MSVTAFADGVTGQGWVVESDAGDSETIRLGVLGDGTRQV